MKISTRTRYGFRFMIALASRYGQGVVQLNQIATEENISDKYLEQIVRLLRLTGFIQAYRGSGGGYTLNKSPETISLLGLFEALEGKLCLVDCECECDQAHRDRCPTTEVWRGLEKLMMDYFGKMNLQDLLTVYHEKRNSPMFFI